MMDDLLAFGPADIAVVIQTVAAMILGAAIGWDREMADKPAGIRTHALVSGAACMLVSLGSLLLNEMSESLAPNQLTGDPFKVMEAVITGVSFLGAGTIIRSRGLGPHVEGLTTAASILATAAVGMTVGSARLLLATALAALVIIVLRLPTGRQRDEPSEAEPAAPPR